MQTLTNDNPTLCIDTTSYQIGIRLTLLALYAATGYGIYAVYENAHEKHGNSAQTYTNTIFTGFSLLCFLAMALLSIQVMQKGIRDNGGFKNWCGEVQKSISTCCAGLFNGAHPRKETQTPLLTTNNTT